MTSVGFFAFNGCLSLSSVTIPSKVITINAAAFSNCIDLTSVTIPNSVTSIGTDAFYGCTSLASATIQSSGTVIGTQAFYGCNNNLTIYSYKGSYAQDYAKDNSIKFSIMCRSFGAAKYSTTNLTNQNVTITIPVNNATVSSVSHTFTENGSYTFKVTDKAGNKATKNVTVSNIDKIKPTIKVSIGNDKSTKGKVTVTISDANFKSKSVKLNGKSLFWPKNNTFISKGSYTIMAVDKAGNTSSASFSIKKINNGSIINVVVRIS